MSNITVDRLRHIPGRRRSPDSFAYATKSPDSLNEPTTKKGGLASGIFHDLNCPGAIFFSGSDPRAFMVGGYGHFTGGIHGALIVHGNCAAVDIPRATNTWVNPSDAQGNIVSRYTLPNSVVPGCLTWGFGKSAHAIDQAAHGFFFTLNPLVVWWCGFSSSVGAPWNWFGSSGLTLFSGEAGRSSTRRESGDSSMLGIQGYDFHRVK